MFKSHVEYKNISAWEQTFVNSEWKIAECKISTTAGQWYRPGATLAVSSPPPYGSIHLLNPLSQIPLKEHQER